MAFTAHTVVEERGLSRELTRATDTLLARAFYILQCWGDKPRMPGILGHLGKCSTSYTPAAPCNILTKAPFQQEEADSERTSDFAKDRQLCLGS